MSNLFRWRAWRATISRIFPHAALVAAALLLAGAILAGQPWSELLNTLAIVSAVTGVMLLLSRIQLRMLVDQGREQAAETHELIERIRRHIEETDDQLMMMVAAAVSESLRSHVEPDSRWRLNLIKEISDYINDD